jgi:hypothetical protein
MGGWVRGEGGASASRRLGGSVRLTGSKFDPSLMFKTWFKALLYSSRLGVNDAASVDGQ